MPEIIGGKRLATFKQTAEEYPAFSEGSLRWLRFNGDENDFNDCVVKIGRLVLIDLDSFDIWLESYKEIPLEPNEDLSGERCPKVKTPVRKRLRSSASRHLTGREVSERQRGP